MYLFVGRVNSEDPVMFTNKSTAPRGKRQAFTPLFADEIEYNDEQRAICGNNRGCLIDFAATGDREVARENLESVEELDNTTSSLSTTLVIDILLRLMPFIVQIISLQTLLEMISLK